VFPELAADPRMLARAVELELCIKHEGEPIAPSAELLRFVRELTKAGVPLATVLDEIGLLRADMDRIADRFRALFRAHVDAHYRGAKRAQLTQAIRRLPAASARAVTILLTQAIERGARSPEPKGPARTKKARVKR
jgi:hypothetical protein